jgi:hypothetical protein
VGILKGERSLAAELVLCLAIVPIVGAIAGYLAPLARSRGRAALVGVVAVLPFAMFVAFTLTPESLRAADLSNTFRLFFGLFSAVVLGAVGGVGYYVGWHARARGERHGA